MTYLQRVIPFHFLLILLGVSSAWPVVHGQGLLHAPPERQLSSKHLGKPTKITLAVNTDGEALVHWVDSAAWTDANANVIDRELPIAALTHVFDLDKNRWFGLYKIEYVLGAPIANKRGAGTGYYFGSGIGATKMDSSTAAASSHWDQGITDPSSTSSSIRLLTGYRYQSSFLLETLTSYSASYEWGGGKSERGKLLRWDPPGNSPRTLYALEDEHDRDNLFTMLRMSRPLGANTLLYRRQRVGDRYDGETPVLLYQRSFSRLDLRSNKVQDTIVIDTVHRSQLDLSDEVLPPRMHGIDLLRHNVTSHSLYVERFDANGVRTNEITLCGPVRVYWGGNVIWAGPDTTGQYQVVMRADYAMLPLSDQTTLLAWSAPLASGDTVILVAHYDSDWQLIGSIKQAHGQGPGRRILPSLAVENHRVYLCWQYQHPDGKWTPWLRVFDLNTLTHVDQLPDESPGGLAVEGPWPHPVSGILRLRLTTGQASIDNIQIVCVDVLGRAVFRRSITPWQGQALVEEDVSALRPGRYTLLIRSVGGMQSRQIVVAR
jgi:hypothetical protein